MIDILKASAGSGKTFRLAKTYIGLLLKASRKGEDYEKFPYRHILAVTFTNKATDEMKSRILKELDILSRTPGKSNYIGYFREEFGGDFKNQTECDKWISSQCGDHLRYILHDYGAFNVSTIDRFFQQTLKAFAREVGQFSSYQVELDKDSLVRESVDRILESITEDNARLIGWLKDSVMESLRENGRASLEKSLYETAIALRSEEHRQLLEKSGYSIEEMYSQERLGKIRDRCYEIRTSFVKEARSIAEKCVNALKAEGIDPEDTNGKFMKGLFDMMEDGYRYKGTGDYAIADGEPFYYPQKTFLKNAPDPEKWFSKSSKRKPSPSLVSALEGPLLDYIALFMTTETDSAGVQTSKASIGYKTYNTAKVILSQIYSLGIAGELDREFHSLLREKNVLSIDDSNTLLKKIIDGSDAPFVYEKLGVRLEHFLLDEFQDTSTIQWDNFFPLLKESESSGRGGNLIVGDVKQSIYRFRGSDWHLLDSEVAETFKGACRVETMQDNWRSLSKVVEFNNGFFRWASARLDERFSDNSISRVYSDVQQNSRTKDPLPGSVQVTFIGTDDDSKEKESGKKDSSRVDSSQKDAAQLGEVVSSVRKAHGNGARYADIAILTRGNEDGSSVAAALIAQGIPVISDEALLAKSSLTVRRIVSLLSLVNDPSDKLGGFLGSELGVELPTSWSSIGGLAEELCRKLREADEKTFDKDILYIQAFMDALSDWSLDGGNNLSSFLKDWEKMDPKISSPEGCDAVRILTIHKSKGLEFPYVIFPFAESVNLYRPENRWVIPEFKGTRLGNLAEGIYREKLSSASEKRLTEEYYKAESLLQCIDNINIFYVSLTRAKMGLHIICERPGSECVKFAEEKENTLDTPYDYKDFSQLLYVWAKKGGILSPVQIASSSDEADVPDPALDDIGHNIQPAETASQVETFENEPDAASSEKKAAIIREDFFAGELYNFEESRKKEEKEKKKEDKKDEYALQRPAAFESFPVKGRLRINPEALEYFTREEHSQRVKGILMHRMLSAVVKPSDLEEAVQDAVLRGDIEASQYDACVDELRRKLLSVQEMGWFPEDGRGVMNEVSLVDSSGNIYRPDRVIDDGTKTVIVDYKFGLEENFSYEQQVRTYAEIYRRMGKKNISAYLWYVTMDKTRAVRLNGSDA